MNEARTESISPQELQNERNLVSAILDTVGALVVVLDADGRVIRTNRVCEETSGYSFEEAKGQFLWDLFTVPEEAERCRAVFKQWQAGERALAFENSWMSRAGTPRLIAWSSSTLSGQSSTSGYVIATGIDITERKRLEKEILEISAREQRRIGQDLHDGLGQHLTGIAFISKVQEQKLADKQLPEATDARKIVELVNEAIHKTKELAHGLLPVVSDAHGLMSALQQWAGEVEDLFHIGCRFQTEQRVLVEDASMAIHLYRIAQEAVHNAIKHGQAKNIVIGLTTRGTHATLSIEDDGCGLPEIDVNSSGLGLQIMDYRARMIGGSLEVLRGRNGGTRVSCQFPLRVTPMMQVSDER